MTNTEIYDGQLDEKGTEKSVGTLAIIMIGLIAILTMIIVAAAIVLLAEWEESNCSWNVISCGIYWKPTPSPGAST